MCCLVCHNSLYKYGAYMLVLIQQIAEYVVSSQPKPLSPQKPNSLGSSSLQCGGVPPNGNQEHAPANNHSSRYIRRK